MRRILHTSDLHFGRSDAVLAASLLEKVAALKPDVVVVSGDLTQRAREAQFREARAFLDAIDRPKVVVPGNHDIPLFNLFARFFRPLANYRKYISDDLSPGYQDHELALLGVNTARSFTHAGGSISNRQIESARRFFRSAGPAATRILVTHHPFDFPHDAGKDRVRRAKRAVNVLAECGADLYLAGHVHSPYAGPTTLRYKTARRAALIVQAGAGITTRTRSGPNSFNVILIERPYISVQHFDWSSQKSEFLSGDVSHFRRREEVGWEAA
jgi:3',5'-cyclic AMP phosphodiesterase CpdA